MKSFIKWVELQEDTAQNVGNAALGNISLGASEQEPIAALFKVTRMAWERYKPQTQSFFQRLAQQDEDIRAELDKIEDNSSALSNATRKAAGIDDPDADTVVPPNSDVQGDGETGDGEF